MVINGELFVVIYGCPHLCYLNNFWSYLEQKNKLMANYMSPPKKK